MELHKIDELLERAGLADPELLRKTPPEKLGALLGVDAVIFGEVSDFDKYFLVMYSQVAVGAEVKMYDAKTGHFLWSGKHKVRKHEGGVSTNPVGIVATVIVTALNMRDIQLCAQRRSVSRHGQDHSGADACPGQTSPRHFAFDAGHAGTAEKSRGSDSGGDSGRLRNAGLVRHRPVPPAH